MKVRMIILSLLLLVHLKAGFFDDIADAASDTFNTAVDVWDTTVSPFNELLSLFDVSHTFIPGFDEIVFSKDLTTLEIHNYSKPRLMPTDVEVIIYKDKEKNELLFRKKLFETPDAAKFIKFSANQTLMGSHAFIGGTVKETGTNWVVKKTDKEMENAIKDYLKTLPDNSGTIYFDVILASYFELQAFGFVPSIPSSDDFNLEYTRHGTFSQWVAHDYNQALIDGITPHNLEYISGTPYETFVTFENKNTSLKNHPFNLININNLTKDISPIITEQDVIYTNGKIQAEGVTSRDEEFIIGGYVTEWAGYGRKFMLGTAMDSTSYNRLVYSFAGICGDLDSDAVQKACEEQGKEEHEMVIIDLWGGFMKAVTKEDKAQPWDDLYGEKNLDNINTTNVRGLMGQLLDMKRENPNLKVAISVGGWTLSEPFHRMSTDPEAVKIFVNSVVAFVKKWGLDGVDIDWEFPGHGGASGKKGINDGKNYANLIKEMRLALDELENETGKEYEVSSAIGVTIDFINRVGKKNYKTVNEYIDNIYLMNYDFGGAWDSTLLHQTNLFPNSDTNLNSVEVGINKLIDYGVDKSKLIIGVANYARGSVGTITSFSPLISNKKTKTQSNTAVTGTFEPGVLEGYDIFSNFESRPELGYELYTDLVANADYFYNKEKKVFYTIDTPRTAYNKAQYAKARGLGGVFTWTVDGDYNGRTVNAMNDGAGNTLKNEFSTLEDRNSLYNRFGVNIDTDTLDSNIDMSKRALNSDDKLLKENALGGKAVSRIDNDVINTLEVNSEVTVKDLVINLNYNKEEILSEGYINIILGYDKNDNNKIDIEKIENTNANVDLIFAYESLEDDSIWVSENSIKLDFQKMCSSEKVAMADLFCDDGLNVYSNKPVVFTITKEKN